MEKMVKNISEPCEDRTMGMQLIKNKSGAAMAEMVIVLPVLLLVLFGIIELSLVLYDKAMITNASREGARAGIVFRSDPVNNISYSPLTEGDISTVVNNYLEEYLVSSDNTASANIQVTSAVGGIIVPGLTQCPPLGPLDRQITVTVTYPYTFFVLPNFIGALVGLNPLNLRAVTVMRCE
jgi:Flp pilus assembly protein TadG